MKTAAACLCAGAIVASAAMPARAGQQTPPVFRGGVQVVTVNAQVIDGRGQPVRDLKPADFVVRINGTVQPVVAATFVAAAPPVLPAPAPAAAAPAGRDRSNVNSAASGPTRPRTVVLVFDDLSYRFTSGDLMAIRAAAQRVLDKLAPPDRVGVATTSGMGPQVAPTTDRRVVTAAITRAGGRFEDAFPGGLYLSFEEAAEIVSEPGTQRFEGALAQAAAERECRIEQIDPQLCVSVVGSAARIVIGDVLQRTGRQTRGLTEIVTALAALPGSKTVVVLSDGLAAGMGATPASELGRFGRAVAESGVQIYAVTGVRDDAQIAERHPARARVRAQEQAAFQNGVENIAGAAGGKALRLVGTVDGVFDRILAETSGVYELRVELPLSNRERVLTSEVSVRRAGAVVLTAKQAIATDVAADPVSVDEELTRMLRDGVPAGAVPLSLAASIRRSPSGGELELGVNAAITAAVPFPLKVRFVLVNEISQAISGGDVQIPAPAEGGEQRFSFAVPLAPGRYQLRLGVADANGNIGTIAYPVRARLTPAGSWFVSDFQTSWDDGTGRARFLALENLPASATTLGMQIELYAADATTAPPETTVVIELTTLDAKAPITSREVPVRLEKDRVTIRASVPVQALEPGIYAIRAIVSEHGRDPSVLVATFRKSAPAVNTRLAGATEPASESTSLPAAAAVIGALSDEAKSAWPAPSMPSLLSRALVQAHLLALAKSVKETLAPPLVDRATPDGAFWDAVAAVPLGARAVGSFARGIVALRLGTADLAGGMMQRAQSQAPSSFSVLVYFGAAMSAANQFQDAAGAWQLAVGDPSIEVEWHVALADVLARVDEREPAMAVLQEAQRRWPRSAEIAERLVHHALAAGDVAGARKLLARTDLEPAGEQALFWAATLAFADAVGARSTETVAAFRAAAERYLKTDARRGELVRRWLEQLRDLGSANMLLRVQSSDKSLPSAPRSGLPRPLDSQDSWTAAARVRRPGGGRTATDPTLRAALLAVIEPAPRGDPDSPWRWTCKSTAKLAAELTRQDHPVSGRTVATLLKAAGYSLPANRKTREGTAHPVGMPSLPLSTPAGRGVPPGGSRRSPCTRRRGKWSGMSKIAAGSGASAGDRRPADVRAPDFLDTALGQAIPYGVYDLANNQGWVSVGIDHDTAELITAAAGGSHGPRSRLWNRCLQTLADDLDLTRSVCHFPPGTSKWNKIEHRLFSFITQNWRGKPLITHQAIVNLIAATSTRACRVPPSGCAVLSVYWEVMRMARLWCVGLLSCGLLAAPVKAAAGPIVIDFDGLADLDLVTGQFAGLTFGNAQVLTARLHLNEFEFPPTPGRIAARSVAGSAHRLRRQH